MKIVDTNYLVRLYTGLPESQVVKVSADLFTSTPKTIVVPDYVISELIYVLQFHTSIQNNRRQIVDGVSRILEHSAWKYDKELHAHALKLFVNTKIDYVDCLVIAEHKLRRLQSGAVTAY